MNDELGLFIGRFHPLLVHFPIGLIILVCILEILGRCKRFAHATAANRIILALTAPAAIASAICGWLLAEGGGYEPQLLFWHKWTGILVAVTCTAALLLHWLGHRVAYGLTLSVGFVSLVVASHFGGSLTHGSDYLFRYAPAPLKRLLAPETSGDPAPSPTPAGVGTFASSVLPVLDRICVSCHGPEKAKGDLRLDSFAAIQAGGANGPVVVPGDSQASALIERILLPLDDYDHMPPAGKPQPTQAEIELLVRWVEAGATAD